ncbi:hypothetical protein V8E54_002083 [Elaphomyces granulatus]|jgi:hypothetical protein
MRPKDFLLSSPIQQKLKRKLDSEDFDTKRVRLDPTPQLHQSTVERYFEDVTKLLGSDRRKLQVLVPVGEQLSTLKQDNNDLRSETNLLKEENSRLHSKVEALEAQQLRLYAGNMLIALGKLAFPKVTTNPTTHRLQQRLQSATVDQELAAANIPSKYWPYLKNISKYIAERNTSAHDTGEGFASLLLSMKESRPSAYFQWADAFPLVYGGTVTELAEKNKCINDDLMGLTSP